MTAAIVPMMMAATIAAVTVMMAVLMSSLGWRIRWSLYHRGHGIDHWLHCSGQRLHSRNRIAVKVGIPGLHILYVGWVIHHSHSLAVMTISVEHLGSTTLLCAAVMRVMMSVHGSPFPEAHSGPPLFISRARANHWVAARGHVVVRGPVRRSTHRDPALERCSGAVSVDYEGTYRTSRRC